MQVKDRLLVADDWASNGDYALLDSGEGCKLERFGAHILERPDSHAIWPGLKPADTWQADARFKSGKGEGEQGHWTDNRLNEVAWPMQWNGLNLSARLMPFRHIGIFPEHSVHWSKAESLITARLAEKDEPPKILNLFGYTGMMSLVAARAGAEVTHIDASPKAIAYGRDNQAASHMKALPIRWICEDALKFVNREIRRGNRYDGVVLDPPKYGRGPKNEVWHLDKGLPELLANCAQLLSDDPLFFIATIYAVQMSYLTLGQTVTASFAEHVPHLKGGLLERGEMAIPHQDDDRLLPTAIYARWVKR